MGARRTQIFALALCLLLSSPHARSTSFLRSHVGKLDGAGQGEDGVLGDIDAFLASSDDHKNSVAALAPAAIANSTARQEVVDAFVADTIATKPNLAVKVLAEEQVEKAQAAYGVTRDDDSDTVANAAAEHSKGRKDDSEMHNIIADVEDLSGSQKGSEPESAEATDASLANTDDDKNLTASLAPASIANSTAKQEDVEAVVADTIATADAVTSQVAVKVLAAEHVKKAQAGDAVTSDDGSDSVADAAAEHSEGRTGDSEMDSAEVDDNEDVSQEDSEMNSAEATNDVADSSEPHGDGSVENDGNDETSAVSLLQFGDVDDGEADEAKDSADDEVEDSEGSDDESNVDSSDSDEEGMETDSAVATNADTSEQETDEADEAEEDAAVAGDEESSEDMSEDTDQTSIEDLADEGAQDAAAVEAAASGEANEETVAEDEEEEQDETESTSAEEN